MDNNAQNMIGQSPALMTALDHLSSLAGIDRPVLILGERGTGKELAAERLHFLSPRWSDVFIKINCGAIAETLLESELFGHEAGAFTGATKQHIGRFERADGGTLFLDELATMSLRLQEKLLRLIEYGEFERVGGAKTIRVDVRIVAATNANLRLPPLRNRQDDVLELANHFAVKMVAELGWEVFTGFSEEAEAALSLHHWPGNIRELKNVVERSVYRWGQLDEPVAEVIINPFSGFGEEEPQTTGPAGDTPGQPESEMAAETLREVSPWPMDLRQRLEATELEWVRAALEEAQYSQKAAAGLLGLSYDQMRSVMRKHDLRTRSARG